MDLNAREAARVGLLRRGVRARLALVGRANELSALEAFFVGESWSDTAEGPAVEGISSAATAAFDAAGTLLGPDLVAFALLAMVGTGRVEEIDRLVADQCH